MARQAYLLDYRQRRKDRGICARCGGKALPAKTVCQRCLDMLKKWAKENYDCYRELHICPKCKRRRVRPYHTICLLCLLKRRWRKEMAK
jgi:uncharacterized OB-fold protein